MTPNDALAQITARADPAKAAEMEAYHQTPRRYLGASNPEIDALTKDWRAALTLEARLQLAADLWETDIHEARIAAAKLLTQARIRPDDNAAWALICQWVPQLDAWAIADATCTAAQKRLTADPARLDDLEDWTQSPVVWVRRVVLVATLPFARLNHLKPAQTEARERALDWAAGLSGDRDWFIQKAVAAWVRDLSKHDAARATAFLNEHGAYLRTFARKEAGQFLDPHPAPIPADAPMSDPAPDAPPQTD